MDQALMERIRKSAYHIWAANGGDAEQNWLQAEAEILNNAAVQSTKTWGRMFGGKPDSFV